MTRPTPAKLALALLVVLAVTSCGGSPLESIGQRSSEWINEPTVATTQASEVTTPTVVSVGQLLWANDDIETANLGDYDALLAEVFERREGDRFVQASRHEIAAALPEVAFPDKAPTGAEWVSSQLVFDNDGSIATDPSAAFGIWSAEPYTRSRSVAQMVVLTVNTDVDAANEFASGEADLTCERFADRTAAQCELMTIGDRSTWLLSQSSGATWVWYEGTYRYELFGRSFVPSGILHDMSGSMIPLASIID
ncbi:MAG TPA: hypothetical protein VK969_10280, partial [Acidimicrobiia bacterium]|nr:hypothetical protein [Acidimicrobiia bacterium]